jgi:hypothetical protein
MASRCAGPHERADQGREGHADGRGVLAQPDLDSLVLVGGVGVQHDMQLAARIDARLA